MILERTKNAKRNIVYGIINKIVLMIFPFLIRFYMIQYLGGEYLGLDSLFISILQVLNLAELGFSSAIVYSMYKPIADDDVPTICAVLKFYRRVYRYVGALIGICGLCILPFLEYFISGSYPRSINLQSIYVLYLASTVVSYWLYAYKSSLLEAYQRQDVISKINTLISFFVSVIKIIVLIYFCNFYLYVFVSLVANVINNIAINMATKKLFPEIVCAGDLDVTILADIKKKVQGVLISKICDITRTTFDSIYVSIFLGLLYTAIYNNYFFIMTGINTLMHVFYSAIVSGVGNSLITEKIQKNYKDMECMNFIYMWGAGLITICMLCVYQPFMETVFGKDLLMPFSAMVLLCIYFYVAKLGDILAIYSTASGLWRERAVPCVVESISNLLLGYILGRYYGLYGVIISTIITLIIIAIPCQIYIVFKYVFTKYKIKLYAYRLCMYVVIMGVTISTICICHIYSDITWLNSIGMMFGGILLMNVLFFLIFRQTAIMQESVMFISTKFNKKYTRRRV